MARSLPESHNLWRGVWLMLLCLVVVVTVQVEEAVLGLEGLLLVDVLIVCCSWECVGVRGSVSWVGRRMIFVSWRRVGKCPESRPSLYQKLPCKAKSQSAALGSTGRSFPPPLTPLRSDVPMFPSGSLVVRFVALSLCLLTIVPDHGRALLCNLPESIR